MRGQYKTNEQLIIEPQGLCLRSTEPLVLEAQHKQIEGALKESEERYKALFDHSLYCVYVHDFEGNFLDANKAALNLLGYTKKDIPSITFSSLLDEDQLFKALKILGEVIQTGYQKKPAKYKLKTKKGDYVWVETEASVIYREGKPYAVQGIARDITEHKLIEEALRESEEKCRSISTSAQDGIIMIDNDGNISYWNDAAETIFGYTKEEAIGKFMKIIIPERYYDEYKKGFSRFVKTGKGQKVKKTREFIARRKDGTEFPLELSLAAVKIKDKWNALGTIRDITKRKLTEKALVESEKRFRELWNNAPVAYHTLDTNGIITSVNQTEKKMLGYTHKEMVGKSIFEFILPEQQTEAQNRFKQKTSGKHVPRTENRTYIKKDGSKLYVYINDVLERNSHNRVTGIRTTMVDITDRKQTEEALQGSKERYKALFDRSLYCVYVHDFEGNFLDANKAALNMLGYTKKDISSITFSSLLDEEQLPIAIKSLGEILKNGYQKKPTKYKLKTKKGDYVWAETEASLIYRKGKPYAVQGIARDITKSTLGEEALQESKEKYRTLAENAMDGIYIISPEEGFEYVNPAFEKIFGYKAEEVCKKDFNFSNLIYPDDRKLILEREKARKKGKRLPPVYSFRILTKNGNTKNVEVNTVPLPGERVRILGILRDVTQRTQAEEALRESEKKFHSLAEKSPNMIFIYKKNRIIYANKRCEEATGYKREEFYSPDFSFFRLIAPESLDLIKSKLKNHRDRKEVKPYEYSLITKDDKRIDVINTTKLINYEGENAILGVVIDITERKRTERIQASLYKIAEATQSAENLEELYQILHKIITELMPAKNNFYIALYDEDSEKITFPYFVDEYEENPGPQKLGKGLTEYVLRTGKPLLASPKVFETLEKKGEVVSIGPPSIDWLGVPLKTEDKIIGVLTVQSYTKGLRFSEEDYIILTFISDQVAMAIERKQKEDAIRASEEKFKTMFNNASDAIFIHDLGGRFMEVNQVACKRLGYTKEELLKMNLMDLDSPKLVTIVPARTDELSQRGHIFYETVHVRQDGTAIPIELSSRIIEYEGEPVALSIARDITERKQAEEERKQNFERLRKSLEETINALAAAVEMRDPYTAGHQQRTTTLACAIAKEMDLSKYQIEGIRMAGIIHDVGKIKVPAEILSWPDQLTEVDFNVIKTHPQVGYDILKNIELPYSVAQIVLQHHERMNGSGYPAGLSGEDILLEARVLLVADVVEAMASHRPYRPALGVDKALEEIKKNTGVLYDSEVVNVCLKLFNEKSFKFNQLKNSV